eukprot:6323261-Amphidinium_carterae.2
MRSFALHFAVTSQANAIFYACGRFAQNLVLPKSDTVLPYDLPIVLYGLPLAEHTSHTFRNRAV